jgi:hypothetical protein
MTPQQFTVLMKIAFTILTPLGIFMVAMGVMFVVAGFYAFQAGGGS